MIKKILKKEKPKAKVGIFSLTCCDGCQVALLDLEDDLLEIIGAVDIVAFPLAKGDNREGPYDIAFIEGAVCRKEEIEKIKKIRDQSKLVVALGTCATHGCLPAVKNFNNRKDVEKAVYDDASPYNSIDVSGIDKYIDVDYKLRGCPINNKEFLMVLKDLLQNKRRLTVPETPVCYECRLKGNECLLEKGQRCLGPITYGGCDSVCTSQGIPCYGCRGPTEDANISAIMDLLKDKNFTDEDIKKMFIMYCGTSKRFSGVLNGTDKD